MPSTRSRSTARSPGRQSSRRNRQSSAKAAALLGVDLETTKRRSRSRVKTPSSTKAAKDVWKPKNPPVLNCSPPGFKPGWATTNFFLCPANLDYLLADAIVPWLYVVGVNTPNKITILNCFLRAFVTYLLWGGSYFWVTALLPLTQVLDCADGQCAR